MGNSILQTHSNSGNWTLAACYNQWMNTSIRESISNAQYGIHVGTVPVTANWQQQPHTAIELIKAELTTACMYVPEYADIREHKGPPTAAVDDNFVQRNTVCFRCIRSISCLDSEIEYDARCSMLVYDVRDGRNLKAIILCIDSCQMQATEDERVFAKCLVCWPERLLPYCLCLTMIKRTAWGGIRAAAVRWALCTLLVRSCSLRLSSEMKSLEWMLRNAIRTRCLWWKCKCKRP